MALVPLQVLPERLALEDKAAGRRIVVVAVAVTVTVVEVALGAGGKILLRLR